jgi:hypothetical protein
MTEIDKARWAFLVTICEVSAGQVSKELVDIAFRVDSPAELRKCLVSLDEREHFDALMRQQ